jgi:hypothetical protein
MKMLDNKRLGKQRVEAYQLLNILEDIGHCVRESGCEIDQVTQKELEMSTEEQAQKYLKRCQLIKNTLKEYKSPSHPKYAFNLETLKYENMIDGVSYDDRQKYRKVTLGFASHPAVRMWVGYTSALKMYINASIEEWIKRGFTNTMKTYDVDVDTIIHPWWRMHGLSPVILSHIFSLKRKEPSFYDKITIPQVLAKWKEHGYSWPPNLAPSYIAKLINGEYVDPEYVTVEIMAM